MIVTGFPKVATRYRQSSNLRVTSLAQFIYPVFLSAMIINMQTKTHHGTFKALCVSQDNGIARYQALGTAVLLLNFIWSEVAITCGWVFAMPYCWYLFHAYPCISTEAKVFNALVQ